METHVAEAWLASRLSRKLSLLKTSECGTFCLVSIVQNSMEWSNIALQFQVQMNARNYIAKISQNIDYTNVQ